MLRNLINTIKRFRTATLLNLFGLTVAFLAFMVVIIQVEVEYNHDTSYSDADRIYRVELPSIWEPGKWSSSIPRPQYDELCNISPQIEQSAIRSFSSAVFGGERYKFETPSNNSPVFENSISYVCGSFLDMFGVRIVDGVISQGDPNWLIIPKSLADKYFSNTSAVGKVFRDIDDDSGEFHTVSAVYDDFPSTSSFPNQIYANVADQGLGDWGNSNYSMFVKLRSKESLASVQASMSASFTRMANEQGKIEKIECRLLPVDELYFSADSADKDTADGDPELIMIFAFIALLIIVVAGINYLNFTTALIPSRVVGINTRKLYGASNGSIRVQMVIESVSICLIAYLIACVILLSFETLDGVSFITTRILIYDRIGIILFTGVIALFLGVFASLYPAFYATSFKTGYVLKGSFALSSKGRALRLTLIGIQYIFSIGLIIMAIVMNLQYNMLRNRNLGFDRQNVITLQVSPKMSTMRDQFIDELKSNPQIIDITYADAPFFTSECQEWKSTYGDSTVKFEMSRAHSSFMDFFDMKIIQGRNFNESDDLKDQNAVAVFNQTAHKQYGIQVGQYVGSTLVVGIMQDVNYKPLVNKIGPFAIFNSGSSWITDSYCSVFYIRCASNDYKSLIEFIKNKGLSIDPNWMADVSFMDSRIEQMYQREARSVRQITLFSVLAILISLVGVFGLVHFEMVHRRREIALRKINGATMGIILRMFNRRFVYIIALCFVLVSPVAWFAAQKWLEGFAYKISVSWWIFCLALIVVLLITILTVTIQSWLTIRENPVDSLKSE